MRSLLLTAMLWIAAHCYAQPVTLITPASGQPVPFYYSGTNCRASGFAYRGPFVSGRLKIIGGPYTYVVDSYNAPPGGPYALSLGFQATFDSSHFAPGTLVKVRIEVEMLNDPTTYSAELSGRPVKNRVMMFEHPDPGIDPDPSPRVDEWMAGRNYDRLLVNGGPWSKTQYLIDMQGTSVVFCATHGSPAVHESGDGDFVDPSDYLNSRTSQVGSGLPPENSTAQPQISFMHLLACEAGEPLDPFNEVNYPYATKWSNLWMENQGHMSYTCFVLLKDYRWHSNFIWSRMAQGKTGRYVKQEFDQFVTLNHVVQAYDTFPGGAIRWLIPDDLAFFYHPEENGCVRIKSVYTGTNVLPVGWYTNS